MKRIKPVQNDLWCRVALYKKVKKGTCTYLILTQNLRRATAVMTEMQKAYMVPKKIPQAG